MFHLDPSPPTLWTGIAVLVVTVILCFLGVWRSGKKKRSILLEFLRFTIVLLIVLLFWNLEWHKITRYHEKPSLVLLKDTSGSIQTRDVSLMRSGGVNVITREQQKQEILELSEWKKLKVNTGKIFVEKDFAASETEANQGTDLSVALRDVLELTKNLQAVVLLSDGDHNFGESPIRISQEYRERRVPIFTIPLGSETRLPDLEIVSVNAPSYGIVGENVQIPFVIRSSLDRVVQTTVTLEDSKGRQQKKAITLQPNVENYDSVYWKLEGDQVSNLKLSFPLQSGELIEENNSLEFNITAKSENIRVLVIDSLPRWEYRFLRNALSRDPGVELSCLLLRPNLGPGRGADYISQFPAEFKDLSKFDVVFLGDVGLGENGITNKQAEDLVKLVKQQASGLVFLPGSQGKQENLSDSLLADLLPVWVDVKNPKGFSEPVASSLLLTRQGNESLLTMLAEKEENNASLWSSLPGFFWHAPVLRAKAGTTVLAVHATKRGKNGSIPLLVTKPAGNGKVLYMGIDSAWRWRKGVEDKYHYRFWGQVARWMSYRRNMAAGENLRLYFSPERPRFGDTVILRANAFGADGAPLQQKKIPIDLTTPKGDLERVFLMADDSAWGAYTGSFEITAPGDWVIQASSPGQPESLVESVISVPATIVEKIGQPARPDLLAEISSISRGQLVDPQTLTQFIQELESLPEPSPEVHRIQLRSHWLSLTTLSLLLGIFWVGRKLNGAF